MKTILLMIAIIISISVQAQDGILNYKSHEQREQELLEIINNDTELLTIYNDGKKDLNTAKLFAITTVALLAVDAYSIYSLNDAKDAEFGYGIIYFPIVITSVASVITGVISLVRFDKGNKKIRKAKAYAQREVNKFGVELDLIISDTGIGLVYTF